MMIQSSASNQDIGEIVRNIYNCVVEGIKYYDINKSILQRYQEDYESWNNNWNIFADSYHKYQISNYKTNENVGEYLNNFKDETLQFIKNIIG